MTYKAEALLTDRDGRLIRLVALAATLALAWWSYSPGFSGGWHFDDHANLKGLEQIDDLTTGLLYSTSGFAGPLKRPVALATFALQAEHWPGNPSAFLKVNVGIHVLNGAVVFWLALNLAGFLAPRSPRHFWFALAVAAAWVYSPFLASASLMAVQRMTTLAATFMFAGLAGYLAGRRQMDVRPRRGMVLALFSLGAGTLLAALTKENGLLLPLLALICETLIVQQAVCPGCRLPKRWQHLALTLPSALVVSYLIWRGTRGAMGAGFDDRPFDLAERLMTQARALWDYAFNLLLPQADSVTPFSDSYPASPSLLEPTTTLISVIGLAAVLVLGLAFRRRWPTIGFGIAWFLGAHLIESTTVPLELYFAHRNYVPAFGLFFALIWPLFFSGPLRRTALLGPALSGLFVAGSAAVLVYSTWIWGRPDTAAQVWYEQNPASVRAIQALSSVYARRGGGALADEVLGLGLARHPGHQMLTLQRLRFCPPGATDLNQRLAQAKAALATPHTVRFGTAIAMHRFVLDLESRSCPDLNAQALSNLAGVALVEPERHQSPKTTEYIHYSLAQLAQARADWPTMRSHLKHALSLEPDPQTAILIAWSWVLAGNLSAAQDYLSEQLASPPPMSWLKRRAWEKELQEYLDILRS